MEPCTVSALAGVIVGAALTAGIHPRAVSRVFGHQRIERLIRLLDLLEEPEPERKRYELPARDGQ